MKQTSSHTVQGLMVTEQGLERAAAAEAREIINAGTEERVRATVVKAKSLAELCTLCYTAQTTSRVLYLLAEFPADQSLGKTIANLSKALSGVSYGRMVSKKTTCRVSCERVGSHDYKSTDAEQEAGDALLKDIREKEGFPLKISLDSPELIFYLYIVERTGYLGLDLCGKDLGKREYKIFLHPQTIKGTLAAGLLRMAGCTRTDVVLDPFCGAGTIPIEAALYKSRRSPHHFSKDFQFIRMQFLEKEKVKSVFPAADKRARHQAKKSTFGFDKEFRNVQASAKNAKIAGVEKEIEWSRIDIEWLDTRLEKGSVDRIITQPPQSARSQGTKQLEATYRELFYQAAFILKPRGTLTLLMQEPSLMAAHAKEFKFRELETMKVYAGKQAYEVQRFQR